MARIVEVLAYDPVWKIRFEEESARILQALNEGGNQIHHIGSTSVPGMTAKPVIDMLLEVDDLRVLDAKSALLERLGYESRGENGIPERRYFQKGGDSRTHHIHAFLSGSEHVTRHLYLRNYLLVHPIEARKYSDIKKSLAAIHRSDPKAYVNAKSAYVLDLEQRARIWSLSL